MCSCSIATSSFSLLVNSFFLDISWSDSFTSLSFQWSGVWMSIPSLHQTGLRNWWVIQRIQDHLLIVLTGNKQIRTYHFFPLKREAENTFLDYSELDWTLPCSNDFLLWWRSAARDYRKAHNRVLLLRFLLHLLLQYVQLLRVSSKRSLSDGH